jgi:hypothetical protein
MPGPDHVQGAYPGDALGEALPAHWSAVAVYMGGIAVRSLSMLSLGMRAVRSKGSGEQNGRTVVK